MLIAVHPQRLSVAVTEALLAGGYRPVPVADAADMADQQPAEGWTAMVVELDGDAERTLGLARRCRDAAGVAVLIVARPDHLEIMDAAGEFDDLIVAPFTAVELALRLKRLGAGGDEWDSEEVVRFKDLELNTATYQATVGGRPVDLTFMEYELLRFFVSNPGRAWSREQILSRVWGYDYFGGARTVDVHVRRLRAKLGEERASWIVTIRSVGYRFG